MEQTIDLVVTWVDGNDPAWRKQRKQYEVENRNNNSEISYRNWDLMRYWFRGVEKNLPWIRKVHFVTWGHLPKWLNLTHPKLHIVKHEDFIPHEFLPTFSANPIELNMHNIQDLSNQFIYANDDTFFVGEIDEDYYFKDGLPCDCLCLMPISENCMDGFGHIMWNDIACINRNYSLRECMNNNEDKWFSEEYSHEVIELNKTGALLRNFPGFCNEHLPIPFLKSTFEEVWKKEAYLLGKTCRNRFRSNEDVSDWLIRYWQLAKGNFVPRMPKGIGVTISQPKEVLRDVILNAEYPVICLNECEDEIDFEERSTYLHSLFEIILPEMSSFELY